MVSWEGSKLEEAYKKKKGQSSIEQALKDELQEKAEEKASGGIQVIDNKQTTRKRGGGGGSYIGTPTPSASDLSGTTKEKEEQIKQFQQTVYPTAKGYSVTKQLESKKSSISAYNPMDFSQPFKTDIELGVKKPFYKRVTDFLGREYRFLTNQQTVPDRLSKREIPIYFNKPLYNTVIKTPTKTVIDKNLIPDLTLKQYAEQEYFVGAVQELGLQKLPEVYGKKYEEDYNKIFESVQKQRRVQDIELQKNVDLGIMDLTTAKRVQEESTKLDMAKLELSNKELYAKYNKQFELSATNIISNVEKSKRGALEKLEMDRSSKQLDIYPLIKTGAIVGGALISPTSTLAVTGALGVAEIFSAERRPTKQEKMQVAFEGVTDIAIGSRLFSVAKSEIQTARLESELDRLSKQSYKIPKLSELRAIKGKTSEYIVTGTRKTDLLKERLVITGVTEKQGKLFITPKSMGVRKISGVISDTSGLGIKSSPKGFMSVESFDIGAKGFSIPITKRMSLSISKGVLEKTFQSYSFEKLGFDFAEKSRKAFMKNMKFPRGDYFKGGYGAISYKLGKNLYLSKIGKIENIVKYESIDESFLRGKVVITKPEETKFDIVDTDELLTKIIKGKESKQFSIKTSELASKKSMKQLSPTKQKLTNKQLQEQFSITELKLAKESFNPRLMVKSTTKNVLRNKFMTTQMLSSGLSPKLAISQRSYVVSKPKTKLQEGLSFSLKQTQLQRLNLNQLQKQNLRTNLKQLQNPISPITTNIDFGFSRGGFVPFPLALPKSLGGGNLFGFSRMGLRGKKVKIRPSFTAQVFDLRGKLPKQTSLGITPFQLRRIQI